MQLMPYHGVLLGTRTFQDSRLKIGDGWIQHVKEYSRGARADIGGSPAQLSRRSGRTFVAPFHATRAGARAREQTERLSGRRTPARGAGLDPVARFDRPMQSVSSAFAAIAGQGQTDSFGTREIGSANYLTSQFTSVGK